MPSATFGFRGNPASLQIGTGSYTVPAGKYAYVTAQSLKGQDFLLNATTAIEGGAGDADATVSSAADGTLITFSGACIYSVYFKGGAAGSNIAFRGAGSSSNEVALLTGTTAQSLHGLRAVGNDTLYLNASGSSSLAMVKGYYESSVAPMGSFWVPTGTTVNQGNYVVQLFNI